MFISRNLCLLALTYLVKGSISNALYSDIFIASGRVPKTNSIVFFSLKKSFQEHTIIHFIRIFLKYNKSIVRSGEILINLAL